MEILGHSQIGLTMNTYTHVVPELSRAAATGMQKFLVGAGKLSVS
jgi:integrase